jgi:hypothetical protein
MQTTVFVGKENYSIYNMKRVIDLSNLKYSKFVTDSALNFEVWTSQTSPTFKEFDLHSNQVK